MNAATALPARALTLCPMRPSARSRRTGKPIRSLAYVHLQITSGLRRGRADCASADASRLGAVKSSQKPRCRASNKAGEPCGATIVGSDGYCKAHSPTDPLDMVELGRRGGSTPKMTAARRAVAERDDELREKARAALAAALDSDDERRRFEAAKSLFSYRAAVPPASGGDAARVARTAPIPTLVDVVRLAVELGAISVNPAGEIEVDGRVVHSVDVPPLGNNLVRVSEGILGACRAGAHA